MKIKIEKEAVMEAMHNNAYGRNWLIVTENGDWRVAWADDTRQWDPWSADDYVAGIPALFPEGDGAEAEMCSEILAQLGIDEKALFQSLEERGEDWQICVYTEEKYPDDYAEWLRESYDWLISAFEDALNGDGRDLNYVPADSIWGMDYDEQGIVYKALQCPHKFEIK